MARARIAAVAALVLVLLLAATALAVPGPRGDVTPLADVGWPASTGLLVAEVVTGGASASDEYVELTNAAPVPQDLNGLEVVYVTSSGGTVTRKAAWSTTLLLEPGRHLLLANASGIHAAIADATYSGGFAATGGSIVLRVIGGTPVDAVGWGDATNAFVEGVAAAAPAPGSSIERLPGGNGGNTADTNENAADFIVVAGPVPQNLAAAPAPSPSPMPSLTPAPSPTVAPSLEPTPSPSPTAVPSPTPSPTPEPTPAPTPSETPVPTPSETPVPTPTPTVAPTATPTFTPEPTPTSPPEPTPTLVPTPMPTPEVTPSPSAVPSPTPTPTPTPITSIEAARGLVDGTTVTIEGTLTTALGALESGRSGFVQDTTAGIALYLDTAFASPLPAGGLVRATGTLDSRYGQRTLRVAQADVASEGSTDLPEALATSTGAAAEPLEGLRLELVGTVIEAPSPLSDGLGLMVDDGTGAVRVIVGPAALGDLAPAAGSVVVARGPLGQRDSTGTGVAGYRLHATLAGELAILPPPPSPSPEPTVAPSPTPSPTPAATPVPSVTPTPMATPTPSPVPTLSPAPSPTPTGTPATLAIAVARSAPVGAVVLVRGVVTAEAGRLGTPPLLAIGDATGGLPVRLPDGVPAPGRGTLVEVRGAIAAPYGQTEIRPATDGIVVLGPAPLPATLPIEAGAAGEATEGRLAAVEGTIAASAVRATSGDLAFSITGTDGATLRILADASAGLDAGSLRTGTVATFTGIVGQRASRKGALDGYRLWVRDRADLAVTSSPSPSPSSSASGAPVPSGAPTPRITSIRAALLREGRTVTVEGVLTAGPTLLDASGRRVILEDTTGAIEVYLDAPRDGLGIGRRVRITGTVGRAWGAPRLRADELRVLGTGKPLARALRGAPTAAVEWRLVRVKGTITGIHRNGDRWTAEIVAGSTRVLLQGLPGSGVSGTMLVEGRSATIVGIVKRPYPTATDRRFAVVPRRRADVALGPAAGSGPSGSPDAAPARGAPGTSGATIPAPAAATDVDLRDLATHAGERVRVGGLVTATEPDGFRLDDGTAVGRVVLEGNAAGLAAIVEPGDALNAIGTARIRGEPVLVVSDPAGVELVGDLGGAPGDEAGTDAALDAGASAGAGARGSGADVTPDAVHEAVRASLSRGLGLDSVSAGFGTLALVAALSVFVTLARRHRAQRHLRARIAARLGAIGGGVGSAAAGATTLPAAPGATHDAGPDAQPDVVPRHASGAGTGAERGGALRGSP